MDQEKTGMQLQKSPDRRGFVKNIGFATAGLAGAAMLGGKLGLLDKVSGINSMALTRTVVNAGAITDVDIQTAVTLQ